MTEPPVDPDGPDDPRWQVNAHAEALRPVGRSGRGPTIAATLIVLAFVVGVLRPWDLLGSTGTDGAPLESAAAAVDVTGSTNPGLSPAAAPTAPASTGPVTADTAAAGICGYPQGWRSATIQHWAGRRAHVWTAVDVVEATSPTDPGIPFQVVAGDDFTAIGWCAPVEGEERPPLSATGRLYTIDADGTATEVPYARIDPPVPSALGELWTPADAAASADPDWPVGRYVIQLETSSGTWQRWLGLDLRSAPVPAGASGAPSPSALAPGNDASSPPAGTSPGDASPTAGP